MPPRSEGEAAAGDGASASGATSSWAALAPLLAARNRMRVSRDGGRSYRLRDERNVTAALPNQPAAVLLFDHGGCAPIACFDLDSSRGGQSAVARDYEVLRTLLNRHGCRWFADRSPNGGRHIYVPLSRPEPLGEVRAWMSAIAAVCPTLDPQPMLNAAAGCIRPPGARHRSGGHQELLGSLSAAVDALRRPTSPEAWAAVRREIGPRQPAAEVADAEDPTDSIEALHGYDEPSENFMRIARTGDYDTERYRSPSEARQAVIWAAAASGMDFAEVARRVSDGTWRGLAGLYARYSHRHRHTSLARDWRRAVAFEKRRREKRQSGRDNSAVRLRTTSAHQSQRGAVNRQVRVWMAAVGYVTRGGDPAERAVLWALGEAAALTDALVVEHGNRSLAIATGLDQSTVGRVLRRLREAPTDRLLIDLVRPAEGVRAHCYALIVPDLLRPACESKPWRRGRIHAVRPVFRELGLIAAAVYDVLEQAREPLSGREVAQEAGVGHSATYEALSDLASWDLATRSPGRGWALGAGSLQRVAERFGVAEVISAQIQRYRAERKAWWIYLGLVDVDVDQRPSGTHLRLVPSEALDVGPDEVWGATEPEPGDAARPRPPDVRALAGQIRLLTVALGAQIVDVQRR